MGNGWLGYFIRLAVAGALVAGAFLWLNTSLRLGSDSSSVEEYTALLTDPTAERIPAVVESAERQTITAGRKGRTREGYVVEGTVRTQDGEVLKFQDILGTETQPSFDTETDVIVLRPADPSSDVWLLTNTSGTISNLSSVVQASTTPSPLQYGALVVSLAVFGWAGRRYPSKAVASAQA